MDFEKNFKLRNITGNRWDASDFELAKEIVLHGERTSTREDLNMDGGLVIGSDTVSATIRMTA